MLRARARSAPMAILSLLCMTYVMGLLVIAKSYTFENKSLKMRVSRCRVTRLSLRLEI
jgi:hypothetical protein